MSVCQLLFDKIIKFCQIVFMQDETNPENDRAQAILLATIETFAQYGYRKTSMQDLARAAGLSRPALYQYFRNKEDIARHLVRRYFEQTVPEVEAALRSQGSISEQLEAAFRAKIAGMAQLIGTPHGEEFLELGQSVCSDLVADGVARLNTVFTQWLDREAAQGRVQLSGSAAETARVILAALDGVKTPPLDHLEADVTRLARLLGAGLST